MLGQDPVTHGETTLCPDGIEFWCRRWNLARHDNGAPPTFEEIGLGSIGGQAEGLALVHIENDGPRVLQSSARFDRWLYDIGGGERRPDGLMRLTEMSAAAFASRSPVEQRCSGIHGDWIETRALLAMPVASRWFPQLILFYVGPLLASHGVTETVYRATREGFLMFMPARDDHGAIVDFRIAAANPGAAALLRRDEAALLWQTCTAVFSGVSGPLLQAFIDVLETGKRRELELDLGTDAEESHLRALASPLDSLVVLTLTDVTEVRAREAGFRLMFEANPVPMGLVDTATMRFLDVNSAALLHYGYTRDQMVGAPHTAILHPDEHQALRRVEDNPAASYEGAKIWRHLRADGSEIAVRPYARRLSIRKRPAALVAFFDVTESQVAEEALRSTKLFVDTIIENIPSALLVEDAEDGRLLLINRTGEALLGLQREVALGQPAHDHFGLGTSIAVQSVERPFRSGAGDPLLLSVRKFDVPGGGRTGRYRLTVAEDVTERRAIERKIAHMAHHDALTDLPNRILFSEQVAAAIERTQHDGSGFALLAIDLDAFKTVNDTLGHRGGDALLQAVAARLSAALKTGDSVARLGGDEFAVLAMACTDTPDRLAARTIADLSRPYVIHGHEVRVGASIGIALSPADGTDGETLLRDADLALYRAKNEGKKTFRFFKPSMNHEAQLRREIECDLHRALTRGEFALHYQPVVDLSNGRVSGFEALIRWHHPKRGLVSHAEFIPLAEETGLIVPIGAWALRQACSDASRWPEPIKVAVNVSAVQFRDPHLIATVVSALSSAGLPAQRLEIEITETLLLADTAAHLATLHRFRDLGVRIAMDDFGTGYSSLGYLNRFPCDKIKIDQSFVRHVGTSRYSEAIVKAVIDLGHHLGITTVAEGVETDAQLEDLRDRGCQLAQGYLFSRPVPVGALAKWLSKAEDPNAFAA